MNMRADRVKEVEVDSNEFHLYIDGELKFICEREHITFKGSPARGHWLLNMVTPLGKLIVERDQYSNDIRERVQIHAEGRRQYGDRYRIPCVDRATYEANIERWIKDAKVVFGEAYSGEYESWNKSALLEKI